MPKTFLQGLGLKLNDNLKNVQSENCLGALGQTEVKENVRSTARISPLHYQLSDDDDNSVLVIFNKKPYSNATKWFDISVDSDGDKVIDLSFDNHMLRELKINVQLGDGKRFRLPSRYATVDANGEMCIVLPEEIRRYGLELFDPTLHDVKVVELPQEEMIPELNHLRVSSAIPRVEVQSSTPELGTGVFEKPPLRTREASLTMRAEVEKNRSTSPVHHVDGGGAVSTLQIHGFVFSSQSVSVPKGWKLHIGQASKDIADVLSVTGQRVAVVRATKDFDFEKQANVERRAKSLIVSAGVGKMRSKHKYSSKHIDEPYPFIFA